MTKQLSVGNVSIQILAFGNSYPFTDMAEDTFFTARYDQDLVTKYKGADGSVAYSKMASKNGQIDLVCPQTSPLNALLSRIKVANDISPKTLAFNIVYKELDNGTKIHGQCVLFKHPDIESGNSIKDRTWTLDLPVMSVKLEEAKDIELI